MASGSTGRPRPGRGTLQDALEPDPLPARPRRQLRRAYADGGVPGSAPAGATAHRTTRPSNTPAAGGTSSSTSSANCHRNGIAVILDVVYNHYTFDAERAEWAYDSNAPENNIYYWYEGRPTDYRANRTAATSTTARAAGRHGSGRRWCARCSPRAPPRWPASSILTASASISHRRSIATTSATPTAVRSARPTSSGRSCCASGRTRCG